MKLSINKSFTLIELLLVVGIMGLVMGVTLPAFSKMAKSGSISSASRNITAKINGARAYAVAKRVYVALVFPTSTTADPNIPGNLRYSAFRPAIVRKVGTNYNFSNWIDGENWDKMPTGAVFGGRTYSPTTMLISEFITPTSPVNGCKFDEFGITAKPIANCIIFAPSGMLASLSNIPTFRVWEGAIVDAASNKLKMTNYTLGTDSGNYVELTVNPFTGRVTTNYP